jgi:hypothetical protein
MSEPFYQQSERIGEYNVPSISAGSVLMILEVFPSKEDAEKKMSFYFEKTNEHRSSSLHELFRLKYELSKAAYDIFLCLEYCNAYPGLESEDDLSVYLNYYIIALNNLEFHYEGEADRI